MQTIFRLPWCQEKAALDKMRPAQPVVEIPMLQDLKRKRIDSLDAASPQLAHLAKKQRPEVEYPQQLLTPSSPHVDSSLPFIAPKLQDSQKQYYASPAATPIKGSAPAHSRLGDQTVEDLKPTGQARPTEAPASRNNPASVGGYFEAKPLPTHSSTMAAPDSVADPLSGLTPLQQVIDNEFNMQILMKHNELRLIEQELAKCQVALEQLRRCQLRPFPGSQRPELSVSDGSGPAVQPAPGFSKPSHAAPYGVTDGPYSRHYARWLLHDPQFDSFPLRSPSEQFADPGRMHTRHQGQARKSVVSKTIGVGTRATEALQSIPNYPAAAPIKDKSPFQVLRRSTDGQLVKLICKDCKRGNFSSIQGFLNHCRIAHKVDYKSHDAAAIDCGQLLEEHELASVPLETQTAPPPKPKATPARAASVSVVPNRSHLVHPMNTPGGAPAASRPQPQISAVPVRAPAPTPAHPSTATPFKASAQAPRLSAFFAKHNIGGDLAQATANAKQQIDLSADDELLSPSIPDESPLPSFSGAARIPSGAQPTTGFPRPESRKGYRQPLQRPRPAPLAPAPPPHHMDMHHSALSSPHDLSSSAAVSPHAADSNPGLVSDHEDDDHASASDEESSTLDLAPIPPRLPRVGARSCDDHDHHMDLDIVQDDEMDSHGLVIRRNSMTRGMGSPSRKLGGK